MSNAQDGMVAVHAQGHALQQAQPLHQLQRPLYGGGRRLGWGGLGSRGKGRDSAGRSWSARVVAGDLRRQRNEAVTGAQDDCHQVAAHVN
jgi:hypothetical protein